MPPALGATLRILQPAPHVLAFYDGRVPGVRLHSPKPNWLDDGAYEAGIASYAVFDGAEALIYDTHISLTHARIIRETLAARGVTRFTVVLSHWHDDHVAGNDVFADCEIIANRLTADILAEKREALEAADPPICPLILPNRTFEGEMTLTVGTLPVRLIQADIHSRDGTVLLLPGGLLLAGDTLEDPVTYVDEPDRLAVHLVDLERMAGWDISRILPNHGAEEVIAAGGYGPGLIAATQAYVRKLLTVREDAQARGEDLRTFAAEGFASGTLRYFAPYEAVHRMNVEAVLKAGRPS
ncbi:MBL fold metallo-hydrolase [Aquabacter cavernae]|uniref:MBL fold metallo-hydrolase n=1 Tax=Aquabacter cavernae TaxID=2496029 RepID=UPI000F8ED188|nr:MBL fold metallo-hydrolase [Aquabacter cavernae]